MTAGTSEWSAAKCAGYALAALIAGDRELSAADALVAPAAARTRALIAHERGDAPRDRRARVELIATLMDAVRPAVSLGEQLPPRVRALLAARLSRAAARTPGLPSPRPGYVAPEELWPRLYRIARYHGVQEP